MPDSYEFVNTRPSDALSLDPSVDQDGDGISAFNEFAYGTSDLVPSSTEALLGGATKTTLD